MVAFPVSAITGLLAFGLGWYVLDDLTAYACGS